jgi:preprotein translocase subunit SecF
MKSKKTDYIKFFKPIIIVFCLVIVVSAFVFGLLGFNKGVDFTGGTQLVVQFELTNIDIENDKEFAEASTEVRNVLKNNKVSIESFQVQGEYESKSFVIIFKETNEDVLKTIRTDINKKFNTSTVFVELLEEGNPEEIIDLPEDITRQTTHISGFVASTAILTTIACVLFALVALVVYASFRISVAGALSMLFGAVFSVISTLCLALIIRVEINRYVFTFFAVLALISVASISDLFFVIKDKSRDPKYEGFTNYDIANLAVSQTMAKRTIVYALAFASVFVLGLLSRSLAHLSVLSMIGLLVSFYSSVYVAPGLYATINKKRTKLVTQKVAEQNLDDKSAEVIEIKE